MISIKALLTVSAAVATAVVIATVALKAIGEADWTVKHIVESIKAEKTTRVNKPVEVRNYLVYYNNGAIWNSGEGLPLYALAVGNCPPPDLFMGKRYTLENNTVHLSNCSFLLPAVGARIIHYYATCDQSTHFTPEAVELEYQIAVRLVIVKC